MSPPFPTVGKKSYQFHTALSECLYYRCLVSLVTENTNALLSLLNIEYSHDFQLTDM